MRRATSGQPREKLAGEGPPSACTPRSVQPGCPPPRPPRPTSPATRWIAVWMLGTCMAAAVPARAQQTFPYKAYVTAEDVYVRSGPGQSYYPTDRLQSGQAVEVYRHDPGGWYAIRPVEGSFSWVDGRFLELKDDGLAVVTEDRLAARVGSRLSDVRDVIQVRLNRGELVEILGKRESQSGADGRTWYKIAPPSGEFRWISGRYVDPDYPVGGVRKNTVDPAAGTAATVPSGAAAPGPAQAASPASSPWTTASRPAGIAAAQGSAVEIPQEALPAASTTAEAGYVGRSDQAGTDLATPATRNLSGDEYQSRLQQIDLELSLMVIEEPDSWSLDELKRRAEGLLSQAQTALERGRARGLVNKTARFDDIKQRFDTVVAKREESEQINRQLAAIGREPGPSGSQLGQFARYDGVGRLTQVVPPRPGAPQYALVDQRGRVACYVTPSPGVNLRQYVGRRVGVSGTRGYMPEQHAQHVMARQISVLDGTVLR
jgi:hypothetical protein